MNLRVYNLLLTLIGLTILSYLVPKTEGFLEVGNPSKGLAEFFLVIHQFVMGLGLSLVWVHVKGGKFLKNTITISWAIIYILIITPFEAPSYKILLGLNILQFFMFYLMYFKIKDFEIIQRINFVIMFIIVIWVYFVEKLV